MAKGRKFNSSSCTFRFLWTLVTTKSCGLQAGYNFIIVARDEFMFKHSLTKGYKTIILFILGSRRSSTAKTMYLLNPRKFQLLKHQYPNTNSPFPYQIWPKNLKHFPFGSVRHCHGIYGSVDVGISGGGGVGAHALDPPPRSDPGSDQNTSSHLRH